MIVLKTMQQCQEKDNNRFMTIFKGISHEPDHAKPKFAMKNKALQ